MQDIKQFIAAQLAVWPLAEANHTALLSTRTRSLAVGGINVLVQHNPCRIASSTAEIDSATLAARPCFLCREHRQKEQFDIPFKGVDGCDWRIQLNPFPIFRDHLVIARDAHVPQSILGNFADMLALARLLDGYAVYYNGPMSGASAPDHLHFQGCPKQDLPLLGLVSAFGTQTSQPPAPPVRGTEPTAVGPTLSLLGQVSAFGTQTSQPPAPPVRGTEPTAVGPTLSLLGQVSAFGTQTSFDRPDHTKFFRYPGYTTGIYCMSSKDPEALRAQFERLYDAAAAEYDEPEPRLNAYAWADGDELRAMVILRTEIRSRHYFADGPEHLTISPGAAEMAGVFVAPIVDDFEKVTAAQLEEMLANVSISEDAQARIDARLAPCAQTSIDTPGGQRLIKVGIMAAPEIEFTLAGSDAPMKVIATPGGLMLEDPTAPNPQGPLPELLFEPGGAHGVGTNPPDRGCRGLGSRVAEGDFVLHKVTIGIDFHWQQNRDLSYAGTLKFIPVGDKVQAINIIGLEDYLLSVISSEMKSSASLNLLKAHAVISRSWCLARIEERGRYLAGDPSIDPVKLPHTLFDVCADDHCQRYQGIGMATGDKVRQAIRETWGETLRYDGELVDARYSKCCGGTTELFSTCWADIDPPYLQSFRDTPASSGAHGRGLKSSPYRGTEGVERDVAISDIFCDCGDNRILSQVLNDYDLETRDFYRWEQRYTRAELSELVHRRTGIDFGTILSLEPVETGPSGRIKYLRITGTLRSEVIGKELAIRRALSPSHLKSSAFEVFLDGDSIVLKGRGWGHGVGLCQIGAAVMADRGYDYREILKHYYRGATIE